MARNTGLLHPTEIIVVPDTVSYAVLASSVGQTFDVPAGCKFVVFGADCNFMAKYGATNAAIPGASATGSSAGEYNPISRNLLSTQATTGISVISPTTGIVSMAWYS